MINILSSKAGCGISLLKPRMASRKKLAAWGLSLFLIILAPMIWNYYYGYSLPQIKNILSGRYIYDAEQGRFTYFGDVYFPSYLLDMKFFDAGEVCWLLSERGEPVLYQYKPAENEVVYRFCAYGYHEDDRVYRIHINEMEKTGYVIYDGSTRIDLNTQQCGETLAIFSEENFWHQPLNDLLIWPELTIIMEGKRGEQYHVIKRYPPNDEFAIDGFVDDNYFHTGLTEFENMIGGIGE